jgi:hypothetical protein
VMAFLASQVVLLGREHSHVGAHSMPLVHIGSSLRLAINIGMLRLKLRRYHLLRKGRLLLELRFH